MLPPGKWPHLHFDLNSEDVSDNWDHGEELLNIWNTTQANHRLWLIAAQFADDMVKKVYQTKKKKEKKMPTL